MTAEMAVPAWTRTQISAERAATGIPTVYTYLLVPANRAYRDGEVFTGVVKAVAPSP